MTAVAVTVPEPVSITSRHVLVAQYVAETFGPQVKVPGSGRCGVWREWFGPGGARPRYARAADGIAAKGHVRCTGPARSSRWTPPRCR